MNRFHVVSREPREDYADALGRFVIDMAHRMMMDEIEFRRWIHTPRGGRAFEIIADAHGFPLFRCPKREQG